MVSFALRWLTFYPILLIVVILLGSVTAKAEDINLQSDPILQNKTLKLNLDNLYFELGTTGKFLTRDGFKYLNIADQISGEFVGGRPPYSIDSFGGGVKFKVGYLINDKSAIELTLRGASVRADSNRYIESEGGGGANY